MPVIGAVAEVELHEELFSTTENRESSMNSSEDMLLDGDFVKMTCYTENPALKDVEVDLTLNSSEA